MGGHGSSKWTSSPQVAHLNASGLEGASRVRPLEWLGEHLVEVLDERQQFRAEIVHRRETAPTDDLAHNNPEHDLDLIEPRAVFGRVHEADAVAPVRQEILPTLHRLQHAALPLLAQAVLDAAPPRHQLHQGGRAMGVQVVHDEHIPRLGIKLDGLVDVTGEVGFRPCRSQGGSGQFPGHDMKVADQRQGAVALVLELLSFALPGLHRQRRCDPLQGLDPGHLIDTDGVGVMVEIQVRGVVIASTNGLNLSLKQLRVFLRGVQPVTAAVGLQLGLAEQAIHLGSRDRLDDAAFDGLRSQLGPRPVGDGQAGLLRLLASQGEQQGELFRAELAGAARTGFVAEECFDGVAESGRGVVGTFDADQIVKGALPASPPHADLVAFAANPCGDVLIGHAGEGEQDEGGALHQSLGERGGGAHLAEHLVLTFGDHDLGSRTGHGFLLLSFPAASWQVGEGSKTRPSVEARFRTSGLARPEDPGAFYQGLRLMGLDGVLYTVPDSEANARAFGYPQGGRGPGAFPQVRKLSLVELGTHAEQALVLRGVKGSDSGEQSMAPALLRHLRRGMLLLWDRGFFSYPLWQAVLLRCELLARVSARLVLRPHERLADGSELSKLYPSPRDRSRDRWGITVRVVRYTHNAPARVGCGQEHVLLTTLLDAQSSPARELILLYHERWEVELTFDEQKTHQTPPRPSKPAHLRSETPLGVVQELYALSIGHYVTRSLMAEAAHQEGLDPDRLSFLGCLQVIRTRLPECPADEHERADWMGLLLGELAKERTEPRRNRVNPRVVRVKMSKFKKKRAEHRGINKLERAFEG